MGDFGEFVKSSIVVNVLTTREKVSLIVQTFYWGWCELLSFAQLNKFPSSVELEA